MMNKRTKHFLCAAIILTILSVLLTIGPAAFFLVKGFIAADVVVEKVALTMSIFVAVIGSLICLISRTVGFRSRIWIILLALFFVLDEFLLLIMVFAITQILDELVVAPLARHFRSKFSINREIDKRG